MNILSITILTATLAFVLTGLLYPVALRFAIKHNIMDNPDARKLQHEPVPVLGGASIVVGLLSMIALSAILMKQQLDWPIIVALVLITAIGITDDIKGLSAVFRFLLEIGIMGALIGFSHQTIDMMQGLFGLERLSTFTAVPFSIFAGVGILNSINLIDGINGYSSGFSIIAFTLFAILFFCGGNAKMGCICVIAVGALIPFFIRNALIRKGKMYIGDGGTMMLGMLLAYCVFSAANSDAPTAALEAESIGLGAFSLAVLCIPIFDTLRVMLTRMLRKQSPFHPDKTHLHHLYIDYGFSHLEATGLILLTNLIIVGCWYGCWQLGASPAIQMVAVCLMGILATFVYYPLARKYHFLKH